MKYSIVTDIIYGCITWEDWLILHGVSSSDFDIDILWLVIYKIFNMDDVKCKL